MKIWVTHAQHKGPCLVCTVPIAPGDEVFVSQTTPWPNGWTWRKRSHLDCWISQAKTHLADNPYVLEVHAGPGRPKKYTSEQARARAKLNLNIIRWGKKRAEFVGMGLWSVGERYQDKVAEARLVLDEM